LSTKRAYDPARFPTPTMEVAYGSHRRREDSGFWAKFPPDGIVIESWYIVVGIGYIITLRVPPARLREVNRAVEQTAWKVFRSGFYPTYDAREIARTLRERALKK